MADTKKVNSDGVQETTKKSLLKKKEAKKSDAVVAPVVNLSKKVDDLGVSLKDVNDIHINPWKTVDGKKQIRTDKSSYFGASLFDADGNIHNRDLEIKKIAIVRKYDKSEDMATFHQLVGDATLLAKEAKEEYRLELARIALEKDKAIKIAEEKHARLVNKATEIRKVNKAQVIEKQRAEANLELINKEASGARVAHAEWTKKQIELENLRASKELEKDLAERLSMEKDLQLLEKFLKEKLADMKEDIEVYASGAKPEKRAHRKQDKVTLLEAEETKQTISDKAYKARQIEALIAHRAQLAALNKTEITDKKRAAALAKFNKYLADLDKANNVRTDEEKETRAKEVKDNVKKAVINYNEQQQYFIVDEEKYFELLRAKKVVNDAKKESFSIEVPARMYAATKSKLHSQWDFEGADAQNASNLARVKKDHDKEIKSLKSAKETVGVEGKAGVNEFVYTDSNNGQFENKRMIPAEKRQGFKGKVEESEHIAVDAAKKSISLYEELYGVDLEAEYAKDHKAGKTKEAKKAAKEARKNRKELAKQSGLNVEDVEGKEKLTQIIDEELDGTESKNEIREFHKRVRELEKIQKLLDSLPYSPSFESNPDKFEQKRLHINDVIVEFRNMSAVVIYDSPDREVLIHKLKAVIHETEKLDKFIRLNRQKGIKLEDKYRREVEIVEQLILDKKTEYLALTQKLDSIHEETHIRNIEKNAERSIVEKEKLEEKIAIQFLKEEELSIKNKQLIRRLELMLKNDALEASHTVIKKTLRKIKNAERKGVFVAFDDIIDTTTKKLEIKENVNLTLSIEERGVVAKLLADNSEENAKKAKKQKDLVVNIINSKLPQNITKIHVVEKYKSKSTFERPLYLEAEADIVLKQEKEAIIRQAREEIAAARVKLSEQLLVAENMIVQGVLFKHKAIGTEMLSKFRTEIMDTGFEMNEAQWKARKLLEEKEYILSLKAYEAEQAHMHKVETLAVKDAKVKAKAEKRLSDFENKLLKLENEEAKVHMTPEEKLAAKEAKRQEKLAAKAAKLAEKEQSTEEKVREQKISKELKATETKMIKEGKLDSAKKANKSKDELVVVGHDKTAKHDDRGEIIKSKKVKVEKTKDDRLDTTDLDAALKLMDTQHVVPTTKSPSKSTKKD